MSIPNLFVFFIAFEQVLSLNWGEFTPCSQTCGGGHHYKVDLCNTNDIKNCPKTFEECNTQGCPHISTCFGKETYYYGVTSSCCEQSTETCGVTKSFPKPLNKFKAKESAIQQWPWAAVIVRRSSASRQCSAILIHKDWVLTTGYCVASNSPSAFYVLLGSTSVESPDSSRQIISIQKFIPHPKLSSKGNDIGLIELATSAILNQYVKPICLPLGEKVKDDITCVAVGWGGKNLETDSTFQKGGKLRHVSMKHIPEEACVSMIRNIPSMRDVYSPAQYLCFGAISNKNYECSGDSGGPVLCQRCASCGWYVAGLASLGPRICGTAGFPEIYTSVIAYESWIKYYVTGLGTANQAPPCEFETFTTCTRTCGGGHRFKVERCLQNDINVCRRVYEECNTLPCKSRASCPLNQNFRFSEKSQCCKKTWQTCGVVDSLTLSNTRIVGGKKSKIGQWPWAVVIVNKKKKATHCGGSLIHKDWVLTAAHCIDVYKKSNYYILLGSTSIRYPKATKQIIEIQKFIVHENYSDPNNDIGLIKLKKSAEYTSSVRPICLPHGENIKDDMHCVAAGWGIARPEDIDLEITSDVLQYVTLRSLPNEACKSGLQSFSWRINYYDDKKNICFGILSGNKDTCSGDSGGPIMCQRCSSCGWYIAGVTSYGPELCGQPGQPAVYTYVEKYESWIREKVYKTTTFRGHFTC